MSLLPLVHLEPHSRLHLPKEMQFPKMMVSSPLLM